MECKFFIPIIYHRQNIFELIETLWNVNDNPDPDPKKTVSGINRNIVECKFTLLSNVLNVYPELIETLWNVNSDGIPERDFYKVELIETLWNVNMLI